MEYNGVNLTALPTRDAFLPILIALYAAIKQQVTLSSLFASLPKRFTQAGLLDDFPREISLAILAKLAQNDESSQDLIKNCFDSSFGGVKSINSVDGVRITFTNGDVAHIRPSGNAPQLRIYSVAGSQERADEIVALGLAENGILRKLQAAV
jgi:phosphomannomutase